MQFRRRRCSRFSNTLRTLKRAAVRWEVKNFERIAAKAKVTQTMTRDGLVVENQADGTVENVSSREAEQDYSTDSEGKTEKILERTEDVKDKHKAKKKAKQAAETAESEDGLHRSAARLELTEEERTDPALQPFIQKADAKADKLDAARAALPKKRVPVKGKVYDAVSGKAKSTLRFEQQDKGPPSLKPNPASRPLSEALLFAHGKIHEVEHENVGVEGGHKGEELVEHQTAKVIRSGIRHHKMKPTRSWKRQSVSSCLPMQNTFTRNPCETIRKLHRRPATPFPGCAETAYQTAVCQSCTAGRTNRRAGCSRHRRERFPGNKAGGRGR